MTLNEDFNIELYFQKSPLLVRLETRDIEPNMEFEIWNTIWISRRP